MLQHVNKIIYLEACKKVQDTVNVNVPKHGHHLTVLIQYHLAEMGTKLEASLSKSLCKPT